MVCNNIPMDTISLAVSTMEMISASADDKAGKDAARKGHSEAEQQKFPVIDTVDANYLRGSGEKDV